MFSDKKNSFWLSIQYVVLLIGSLITLKLNLVHFGKDFFGIWILLASIWGFSTSLDFGFGTSILKFVAEFSDDHNKVSKILSSSFVAFMAIGLILFVAGNVFSFVIYVNDTKIVHSNNKKMFSVIAVLLGISFFLQYFGSFFRAIIDGTNNFVFTSKISLIQSLLMLVGVIIISIFNLNMLILGVLYITVAIFVLFAYLMYFIMKIKKYKISFRLFDFQEIKNIIKFSLSVQAMSVFNTLIDPIIKYIIGNYFNIASVSSYEIARRFAVAISGLFFNAFKIVLPKASALKNEVEMVTFINNDVVKYSRYGVVYSTVIFGVFSLPIILIMNWIFHSQEALLIFLILALPESINNFGYTIYNFLLGVGKTTLLVLVQLNNLFFVIVCVSTGFIIFHNVLGLIGYFISVFIGNLLMIIYLGKNWNISIKEFLIRCRISKLIYLLFIMCSTICFLYWNLLPYYISFVLLSTFSLIVFGPDMKVSFSQVIMPILKEKFL
jgi:O-antigen/teichoic acid export membrane protein